MINSKKELHRILDLERKFYILSISDYLKKWISKNEKIDIWRFQRHLRCAEYYFNSKTKTKFLIYMYHILRKNIIGKRMGLFMQINTIDEGMIIYHSGEIVISGLSKCGKNLKLHGNNCIGNNGVDGFAPVIGDNCDLGFGSVVIGNIVLGNNIKIGANAVVTKNFKEGVIAGVPARNIKNEED